MSSRLARVVIAVVVGALGTEARATPVRPDGEVVPDASEVAADVARIICERNAVVIETPVVRAQRTGVHFAFQNPEGVWGYELREETWDYGTAVGGDFRGAAADDTFSLAPGTVTVACLRTSDASYSDPDAPTARLTIVDPEGPYVPRDLVCGFGDQSRIEIAADQDEDPAEAFQRVPGVVPSDHLLRPNYSDSPQMWPTFLVFRDGVAVARIMGPRIGGQWRLIVKPVPAAGSSGSDPRAHVAEDRAPSAASRVPVSQVVVAPSDPPWPPSAAS